MDSPTDDFFYEYQGLLGTVVDVRIWATDEGRSDVAAAAASAEIERLEVIFTAFDEGSELCRWRRQESGSRPDAVSADFAHVMGQALFWQLRSVGRFNPRCGELAALWKHAVATGEPPRGDALADVVEAIQAPSFTMADGIPVVTGATGSLNLNAIAKGYIVDCALDAALLTDVASISVNAGGDLAHRGAGSVRVGIENPLRPYDNEPPLCALRLSDAAVATSGGARRGFRVGGEWFGHILDPRTGFPAKDIASVSVIAGDAMTADVVATIAAVMTPEEAQQLLETEDGVEGLVVDRHGGQWVTTGWADRLVSES